jgi:hypothetical protein
MTHDSDYFRRRAADARAAAYSRDFDDTVEIAGDLALAYSALARCKTADAPDDLPAIPLKEAGSA